MRFDRFSEDDFASKVLPDGHHEVEIVKVKAVTSKKTGDEFAVIEFRDVNDSYDRVTKWLSPKQKRDTKAAMDINASLGRSWDAEIDESIEGRRLTIIAKRAVKDGEPVLDQDGNQRIYINGFLPAASDPGEPAAEQPRSVSKRTATQKADAATGAPNDDIPF